MTRLRCIVDALDWLADAQADGRAEVVAAVLDEIEIDVAYLRLRRRDVARFVPCAQTGRPRRVYHPRPWFSGSGSCHGVTYTHADDFLVGAGGEYAVVSGISQVIERVQREICAAVGIPAGMMDPHEAENLAGMQMQVEHCQRHVLRELDYARAQFASYRQQVVRRLITAHSMMLL